MVVYVCLEIVHKPHFVGVQRNGRQLYFQIALFKTNQRGVQMRSKIEQNQLAMERIFFVNIEPVIRLQHSGHLRNESLQLIAGGIHRALLRVGQRVFIDKIAVIRIQNRIFQTWCLPALFFILKKLIHIGFERHDGIIGRRLQLCDRIDFQMVLRDQKSVPAVLPQDIKQPVLDNADIEIPLFALILLQLLKDPLDIQQRQNIRWERSRLRHGFDFETVSGIYRLDLAAAVDDCFALEQVTQESLIWLVQDQSGSLLFEICPVFHLDDVELFAFHFIKPANHRQAILMHRFIGGRAFLLQIALEIFHILSLHAEYG